MFERTGDGGALEAHADLARDEAAAGRRQLGAALVVGDKREGCAEALMRLTSTDQRAPLADEKLDRRQRAAHDDRGGDHRAGRQLMVERQPGADAEDGDLQRHADELGDRLEDGDAVAGDRLPGDAVFVEARPAFGQRAEHAHGVNHFGVAADKLGEVVGAPRAAAGLGSAARTAISLAMASAVMASAPATATQPSRGCRRKMTPR